MASDVSMDYLQSQLPCLLLQTSLLSAWACLAQAHSGLSWSLWEPCWACSANTSTQHGGHLSCSHCLRRSFFFSTKLWILFSHSLTQKQPQPSSKQDESLPLPSKFRMREVLCMFLLWGRSQCPAAFPPVWLHASACASSWVKPLWMFFLPCFNMNFFKTDSQTMARKKKKKKLTRGKNNLFLLLFLSSHSNFSNSEGDFKVAFDPFSSTASFESMQCWIWVKSPILGIIISTKAFFTTDRMKILVLKEQTCL